MLSLDSSRWIQLRTAYGNGAAIASWLASFGQRDGEQTSEHWNALDVHGYLCHQGTVYAATYAAIPHLVELATQLRLPDQLKLSADVLLFIGYAAACASRDGIDRPDYDQEPFGADPLPADLRDDYERALARASVLAANAIRHASDEETLSALFAAIAGTRCYHKLCFHITDIGLDYDCPNCGASRE